MTGAGFILAINLFVAVLFSVAFFLVAANNKTDRVALWFGFAYLCGVGYFVFEFLLPAQIDPKATGYLAFASFLAATTTINVGIARRYGVPVPWQLIGAAALVSLAVNWFTFDLPRDSLIRMFAYQAPYAVMQVIGAGIVFRSKRRQAMDVGLMVMFVLGALQFLAKPLVSRVTGGAGNSAQEYIGTNYAMFSQASGAVLSVGVGLLMLMILVRDMLSDVTQRSETDPLSGLFNRRGFDDRAEPGIAAATRGGVPAAMIAVDLDHFKAVNDTYGHEAGDRVIRAFASLVSSSAPPRAVSARIGGEEFAIFLPGVNLPAARLLAESLRSAFANLAVEGLPADVRFSASFGVAECSGEQGLADLRHHADAALYAAKRSGRNRVAVANNEGLDLMPAHPLAGQEPPKRAARSG